MPEISFFWLSVNHSGNVYSALDIFAYEQVFQIQESFYIQNDRVELDRNAFNYTFLYKFIRLESSNGRWPASNSKRMTPQDQTSAAAPS